MTPSLFSPRVLPKIQKRELRHIQNAAADNAGKRLASSSCASSTDDASFRWHRDRRFVVPTGEGAAVFWKGMRHETNTQDSARSAVQAETTQVVLAHVGSIAAVVQQCFRKEVLGDGIPLVLNWLTTRAARRFRQQLLSSNSNCARDTPSVMKNDNASTGVRLPGVTRKGRLSSSGCSDATCLECGEVKPGHDHSFYCESSWHRLNQQSIRHWGQVAFNGEGAIRSSVLPPDQPSLLAIKAGWLGESKERYVLFNLHKIPKHRMLVLAEWVQEKVRQRSFLEAPIQWISRAISNTPKWSLLLPDGLMQVVAERYSCTHFELIGPSTMPPKHLYSKEISCTVTVDSPYPPSIFGKGLLPGTRRDAKWERTSLHANTICAIKIGDWGGDTRKWKRTMTADRDGGSTSWAVAVAGSDYELED